MWAVLGGAVAYGVMTVGVDCVVDGRGGVSFGGMAEIGVIGGSGFYSFLSDAETVDIQTPYGAPSEPPVVGEVGGREVAFIPRHGADHRFPPHRVNYRANLWALRSLGVRRVLAPSAVGALRPDLARGTLVVPDQVIDGTWGRPSTFYDEIGTVVHVGLADPYCPQGRGAVVGLPDPGMTVVDGGTMVVIQGPRFSTRAESRRNAAAGG